MGSWQKVAKVQLIQLLQDLWLDTESCLCRRIKKNKSDLCALFGCKVSTSLPHVYVCSAVVQSVAEGRKDSTRSVMGSNACFPHPGPQVVLWEMQKRLQNTGKQKGSNLNRPLLLARISWRPTQAVALGKAEPQQTKPFSAGWTPVVHHTLTICFQSETARGAREYESPRPTLLLIGRRIKALRRCQRAQEKKKKT